MEPWKLSDVLELAALAGVSPFDPLSPADLYVMAKARQMESWNHTSMVLCMIANANSDKNHQKKPADFHPFIKKKKNDSFRLSDLKKIIGG